jgi:hypothetical protein
MVGKDWQQGCGSHAQGSALLWQIAKGMAYLADMKVGHDW